jgi:hypothetical protein
MFSDCKGDFKDVAMPHNIDELLEAAGLPTDIDTILNSIDDSEVSLTPQPPYFPYDTIDFFSILGTVSTFSLVSYIHELKKMITNTHYF